MALKIGDHVSKQIEIGKPERKFGIITAIGKTTQSFVHPGHNIYRIKWDDGSVSSGHLEIGLQKESSIK